MRRLCIYCKKSFFSAPRLTARRAPKCSAPSNLGKFCSGPEYTPNTSMSVKPQKRSITATREPTSKKRPRNTQSEDAKKLTELHRIKRRKLTQIESKIKKGLEDNSRFFQQSPLDAGGYNPRSQHGSLGSSHTIGNKAAKTGLAISGQAPITMDFSATSFGASYLNQLGQSINGALDPTYHSPGYQPGLASTPKLRTLYIQLQREASKLLVDKIMVALKLSKEQLPNADNNYPSVLVPFILKANIIELIHKKISLSVAQEKAQEVFTTLMATVFVYYASRLNLSVTHRSSFGHVQLSVAPCDTHMRITLGILDPQDFNKVVQAIGQTYQMADQFTSDDNFINMMCLRESDAIQAKSALYNVIERNLKKAYYDLEVGDDALFGHFTDRPTIFNVITYINQLLITDREQSIPYFSEQELKIYTHDWQHFLQQYRLAFGVDVNMSQRTLLNSMSSISQYRMLEFAKKRQGNTNYTTEKWGQDDVSDSEDEITLDDEDCPTFYHKKAGALNGMHCVHKIMDAICHQQKYKQQSLFLSYNTQKMYFETDSVFEKWLSIFRLNQPNIRRSTPAFQRAKLSETSLNILFTDINHCNVSYNLRSEGIFKQTDFKRQQGATYDYYILDITSALPQEVNDSIQKIINLNNKVVIFTLSSLLKLGQLGADFFSQGEIRIFTSSEQQLQELYGSMQQDLNNTYLASQEPRRFMKQVGGSMTVADIFPKARFKKNSSPKKEATSFRASPTMTAPECAEKIYFNFIKQHFTLMDNRGGGDCLYYAFNDGMRRTTNEFNENLIEIRTNAAKATAELIKLGACISPEMFTPMELKNKSSLEASLHHGCQKIEEIRRIAWQQIRSERNIIGPFDQTDTSLFVDLEIKVQQQINLKQYLQARLNELSTAYLNGQSKRGQHAGHRDFCGLALFYRVNLIVHYVDNSSYGATNHRHRVENYNFQELAKLYFNQDRQSAMRTIHIIHSPPQHYVLGIPH